MPVLPFLVSLGLSGATLGDTVGWQDSGFFLTCVHEGVLLHPPGFVLWQALCRLWVALLFFLPFTVAVHLFSAACAAAAAAVLALAARQWLEAPPFRLDGPAGDPGADIAAAATGCLAAAGYSFWASSVLAKPYAFFYLILAALVWRLLRAHETRRPRDFTIVAALIGLAWQAHPSATLAGPALLAFVALHARRLGAAGLAGRIALAALLAVGPSLAGYAVYGGRSSTSSFGAPDTLPAVLGYLSGARFVGRAEAFGLEPSRLADAARFAWEEFLGVGALLALAGLGWTARSRPRALLAAAAWSVPVLLATVAFTVEGQHDFWLVSAWIPLYLFVAAGLDLLGRRAGPAAVGIAAVAGLLWSAFANGPDVSMRGYQGAETYGRLHLERLPEQAVFVVGSDDVSGACQYLQAVKNVRPDVALVRWSRLEDDWYLRALRSRHPELAAPDVAGLRAANPGVPGAGLAAFANANGFGSRPLYFEHCPEKRLLHADLEVVEAGLWWKLGRRGRTSPDPRDWQGLPSAETIPASFRRPRGQEIGMAPDGRLVAASEPYERRLLKALLKARIGWASVRLRERTPEGVREAADLAVSVLRLDPASLETPQVLLLYGTALYALGREHPAETAFLEALELGLAPRGQAEARVYLALLARKRGDAAGAERRAREALSTPGLDPASRAEMERRLQP